MYLRLLLILSLILLTHSSDPSCKTGILSGNTCCRSICGECGGPKCGVHTRQAGTPCCAAVIQASSRDCRTASPPCKMTTPRNVVRDTPDPRCEHGIRGRGVCCPTKCSVCGGRGCGKRGRLIGSNCCAGSIRKRESACFRSGAPCVMREPRRMRLMDETVQDNSKVKKEIMPPTPMKAQDKSAVTPVKSLSSTCERKVHRIAGCFCYILLERVVSIRKGFLFFRHCVDTFGKKSIRGMAKKCDRYVNGSTAEVHISNLVHEINLLIPKCYPPMTPLVTFKAVRYVYSR